MQKVNHQTWNEWVREIVKERQTERAEDEEEEKRQEQRKAKSKNDPQTHKNVIIFLIPPPLLIQASETFGHSWIS